MQYVHTGRLSCSGGRNRPGTVSLSPCQKVRQRPRAPHLSAIDDQDRGGGIYLLFFLIQDGRRGQWHPEEQRHRGLRLGGLSRAFTPLLLLHGDVALGLHDGLYHPFAPALSWPEGLLCCRSHSSPRSLVYLANRACKKVCWNLLVPPHRAVTQAAQPVGPWPCSKTYAVMD